MGIVDAPFAPTVAYQRPTEDADGNASWDDVGSFPTVIELSDRGIESGSGGERAQSGIVFVPRGSDLKIGDRFVWGGNKYMLSGGPNGDMNHPITNDDLGWVSYTCIGQIARWGRG